MQVGEFMRAKVVATKMSELTGYEWRVLELEEVDTNYIISAKAEIYNFKSKKFLSQSRFKGYKYVILRSHNKAKFLQIAELMLRAFPELYADTADTEWRTIMIDGEETAYEVSDNGTVRRKNNHRILKPAKHKEGYLIIRIRHNGKTITEFLHRLVAKAFVPNPCGYNIVNHIDENRQNDCANNLEWCDKRYNYLYSYNRKQGG